MLSWRGTTFKNLTSNDSIEPLAFIIKLYEYKMLSEDDQWDMVFSKGKFLDIVIEGNSKHVLYAIDKFFVEVEWNFETDEIVGKEVFKCGDTLDRYSNVPKEI